jgi:hypothetical protein
MKTPVDDSTVANYVAAVRSGRSTAAVFAQPLSQCDFTPLQRQMIRNARREAKRSDELRGIERRFLKEIRRLRASYDGRTKLIATLESMQATSVRIDDDRKKAADKARQKTLKGNAVRAIFFEGGAPGLGKRA